MAITVTSQDRGERLLITVSGDLDLVTAPLLTDEALNRLDTGSRDVLLDISGLEFCDSSGLSAFARISNRLAPDGHRLALAGPLPIVRRVLEVSGLVEVFIVADSVGDAEAVLAAD